MIRDLKSLEAEFLKMEVKTISEIMSLKSSDEPDEHSIQSLENAKTELQNIRDARDTVSKFDATFTAAVTAKLRKSDTFDRGLIMWLNPGVSCDIKPEPVHLRETLAYMGANMEYASTGFDVYDLFDCDVNYQYQKIMEWMKTPHVQKVVVNKTLTIRATLIRLEEMYLSSPLVVEDDAVNSATPKSASQVEDRMKDIISTSGHMLEDLLSKKINAPDCDGKIGCSLCSCEYNFFLQLMCCISIFNVLLITSVFYYDGHALFLQNLTSMLLILQRVKWCSTFTDSRCAVCIISCSRNLRKH